MAALVVAGLTKRFGSLVAVDDLSFEVDEGTVTGVLGPNGAGKTTTLRMLLGLVTPTAGTATIAGRPYHELDAPKATVGAMLEAHGFHPGRTAANHLKVIATAAGRRVGKFSLGMRQRLGLAGALLGDPEVLVLDEPGNGLDPEGIRWLRGFLRRYAQAGRTVLVSSHALAEVSQTVDRVVIIARGRLVASSTLAELTEKGNLEDVFLELTSPTRGGTERGTG